jgi:hypothetical protein
MKLKELNHLKALRRADALAMYKKTKDVSGEQQNSFKNVCH